MGKPELHLQARFGVNSNQQVATSGTEEETPAADEPSSLRASAGGAPTESDAVTVLQQADQLALTVQVELAWPIAPATRLVFTPHFGIAWTQLEKFDAAVFKDLPDFDEQQIPAINRTLNRAMPLNEYGWTAALHFAQHGPVVFYFGGGTGRREVIRRGVRSMHVDGAARRWEPLAEGQHQRYWHAVWGADLSGFINIRADAIGGVGERRTEPLFRVILARDFPARNK